MTLREMQNLFTKEALGLGDFRLLTKTELANGYCDEDEAAYEAKQAGDMSAYKTHEEKRSQYYAALILRYWYKIFRWMQDSSSLNLEPVDFIEWLDWTFWDAFYYRQWRWEWKAEVKDGRFIKWKLDENGNRIPNPYYWRVDPNAPDKIINRCSGSARGYFYQYFNKDKRKAGVQTYSIDSMTDETGDCSLDYIGCTTEAPEISGVMELIHQLLSKGKGIEALIVDGIVNYDTYKKIKTSTQDSISMESKSEHNKIASQSRFNARKLVKHLNNIDISARKRFIQAYNISKDQAEEIFDKLKNMNNAKLYKSIKKTLIELGSNEKYLSYLV